jgi:hypothetical protein
MRDLAHCAQVCKRWFIEGRALLYVPQNKDIALNQPPTPTTL